MDLARKFYEILDIHKKLLGYMNGTKKKHTRLLIKDPCFHLEYFKDGEGEDARSP